MKFPIICNCCTVTNEKLIRIVQQKGSDSCCFDVYRNHHGEITEMEMANN